jgi:microsomal dipeptidase-like Zn-dependent dipeptidase
MRSNKRRNLSDERLTALALQSDDMMKAIQKQVEEKRREKLIGNDNAKKEKTTTPNSDSSILIDKNQNTTTAIIAETIGVKRNQIEKIKKLKQENPRAFEQVASGKTTTRKLNAEKKAKLPKEAAPAKTKVEDKSSDEPLIIETSIDANTENSDRTKELTDAEILELVEIAKYLVQEIVGKIVTTGSDYKSIPDNQQHFQEIEKIQRELGEKLTNYKI